MAHGFRYVPKQRTAAPDLHRDPGARWRPVYAPCAYQERTGQCWTCNNGHPHAVLPPPPFIPFDSDSAPAETIP